MNVLSNHKTTWGRKGGGVVVLQECVLSVFWGIVLNLKLKSQIRSDQLNYDQIFVVTQSVVASSSLVKQRNCFIAFIISVHQCGVCTDSLMPKALAPFDPDFTALCLLAALPVHQLPSTGDFSMVLQAWQNAQTPTHCFSFTVSVCGFVLVIFSLRLWVDTWSFWCLFS